MPIAINDKGDAVYLADDGTWKPAKKAVNPQTGESALFDGKSWVPSSPPTPKQPTLEEQAQKVYGFDPNIVSRGTILPVGKNRQGETVAAVPQIGVDLLTSALLPGRAAQGMEVKPEDVTKFALDYALPAAAKRLPTGTAARTTTKDIIQRAPSSEDLSKKAGTLYDKARGSGVELKPEKYFNFLADVETKLVEEGFDPMLHSKASAVFNSMTKRLGQATDIKDLMTIRRQIGIAARSTSPDLADERRIAKIMTEKLDGMIDSLSADDLSAGNAEGVSAALGEARSLWSKVKKSDIIENAIDRARNHATGIENGLRIQFRRILNSDKLIRGFSPDEVTAIREVAEGTAGTKMLRLLGKMSFGTKGGSNFLGGTIGVGAGSLAAGTPGAVAVPVLGYVAQKAADASTRRGADLARALAASGGQMPANPSRLAEMLLRGMPAVAGADLDNRRR